MWCFLLDWCFVGNTEAGGRDSSVRSGAGKQVRAGRGSAPESPPMGICRNKLPEFYFPIQPSTVHTGRLVSLKHLKPPPRVVCLTKSPPLSSRSAQWVSSPRPFYM